MTQWEVRGGRLLHLDPRPLGCGGLSAWASHILTKTAKAIRETVRGSVHNTGIGWVPVALEKPQRFQWGSESRGRTRWQSHVQMHEVLFPRLTREWG